MRGPRDRNHQRLIHISEACRKIGGYVAGLSREAFLADPRIQDAVIYQLIIAGEAVGHIDRGLLDKYPYAWFKIKAFRNYAAHEYFNIEVWTVWDIASTHVEVLREKVELILKEEFLDNGFGPAGREL